MSQRTLVTGATGFVGAALLTRLRRDGVEAHGTSRSPNKSGGAIHCCDLGDESAVTQLFERIEPKRVFHLASHVSGDRSLDAVTATLQGGLFSTVNLLVAAARSGVEAFVTAGSLEEYPSARPARYPYAAAKRASHEYVRYFAAAHGLPVTTARLGMVYGPGEPNAQRLVPYVISSQLRGEAPRIANGARRVDWIYIDDIVDGLLTLADCTPANAGDAFDLGTGQAPTTAELVAQLGRITGGPEPVFGGTLRANDLDLVADADRTARAISWRARVPLNEGLERTVAWYRTRPEISAS